MSNAGLGTADEESFGHQDNENVSTLASLTNNDIEAEEKQVLVVAAASEGVVLDEKTIGKLADELGKDVPGYDPGLEWSEKEEKRIVWILDTRLMPWILLSTFVLNMDRTNISNAISDNLPANLGFDINTVNNATSIYAIVFSIFTFSGAILAKRFGPHRWIPILMVSWGIVTLAHATITDAVGYYFVRIFIAITEGGVIPATLVYLGLYYKSTEYATRISWFWGVQSIASAVSGLMASGILQLEGVNGLQGWKWLFIIDGIITVVIAFVLFLVFPRSATDTKGGLRFGGWFDERQARIAVTRVIRADPIKLYYEDHVQWSDVWSAFIDSRLWGHLLITAIGLTPIAPLGTYLPTIIKSFGFNVYVSNALTAPGYILTFISMTIMTSHSDRTGDRGYHGIFSASWLLIGFIILRSVPDDSNKYLLWGILLFISSWPLTHPLNISWMSENMAPLGKRTVASAAVIGAANIFSVWAGQIYQAADAPRFHTGNIIVIVFAFAGVLLWILQRSYLNWINKKRESIWAGFSDEQKQEYNETTKDVGNDRLDF
ncbi:hypothetical protein HK096_005553, partial [Nowakowskiella sp. JEL0078]